MKILFVCTGNTCRSCMAEAIFNSMNQSDNISAASAGLSVVKNSKTSQNAVITVKNNLNMDLSIREAVQLSEDMLENSDLILTMTAYMKNAICASFPNIKGKVFTLNEYVGVPGDIIDPYGGTIDIYENTFNQLKDRILLLFNKIKEDRGII